MAFHGTPLNAIERAPMSNVAAAVPLSLAFYPANFCPVDVAQAALNFIRKVLEFLSTSFHALVNILLNACIHGIHRLFVGAVHVVRQVCRFYGQADEEILAITGILQP